MLATLVKTLYSFSPLRAQNKDHGGTSQTLLNGVNIDYVCEAG